MKIRAKKFYFVVIAARRLRVFEERVLRRIFGPKSNEVTGDWRTLYNEEIHNLYLRQV
jgi:uncharacterized membrane protein